MTGEADALRRLAWGLGSRRAWVVRELPSGLEAPRVLRLLEGSPVSCPDIRLEADAAHAAGATLVVDVTACGPLCCPAARLGADVALARVGGLLVVAAGEGAGRAYMDALDLAAGPCAGLAAQALDEARRVRGRWRASSDNAQVLAAYLRCHPKVVDLAYPGLRTAPGFALAASALVGGFGPVVDLRLACDPGVWRRVSCGQGSAVALVEQVEGKLLSH